MAEVKFTLTHEQLHNLVAVSDAFLADPVVMRFTTQGMTMSLLEPSHSAMMNYAIMNTALGDYYVSDTEVVVRVDPKKFAEVPGAFGKKEIAVTHNSEKANLVFKAGRITRRIPTIAPSPGETIPKMPEIEHECRFGLPGMEFKLAVDKAEAVGDFIELEMFEERMVFRATDYEDQLEIEFTKADGTLRGPPTKALYTRDLMAKVFAGVRGTEVMSGSFGKDLPLRISYSNDAGDILAMLAPRFE